VTYFTLERKQKDIQGQPAHGRGGIELLIDGDEAGRSV
jgi:hypothetical protein